MYDNPHPPPVYYATDGSIIDVNELTWIVPIDRPENESKPNFTLPPGWRYEHIETGTWEGRGKGKPLYFTWFFHDEKGIAQQTNPVVTERMDATTKRILASMARTEKRRKEKGLPLEEERLVRVGADEIETEVGQRKRRAANSNISSLAKE